MHNKKGPPKQSLQNRATGGPLGPKIICRIFVINTCGVNQQNGVQEQITYFMIINETMHQKIQRII